MMARFFYQSRPSFKTVISSLTLMVLVLGLPIGVYLVLQNQDPRSRAAEVVPQTAQTAVILDNKNKTVDINQEFDVRVLVKAEKEDINVISSVVNFPQDLLEVSRISTESGQLNLKWLKNDFDNSLGTINLIAGSTLPGIKTDQRLESVLATITFKAKQSGDAVIKFDNLTQALNTNSEDILENKVSTQVQILENTFTGTNPTVPARVLNRVESLKVLSPQGGDILPYSKPTKIEWSGGVGIERYSVNIYLNGSLLGRVASDITTNSFIFTPSNSLPLAYINSDNVFQVEVVGQNRQGGLVYGLNEGPFGIGVDIENVVSGGGTIGSGDINSDGKIDSKDFLVFLTSFGQSGENKADLNGDKIVNQMDLIILRKLFADQ